MKGIQLVGHGGFDKLVFNKDIPNPIPKDDEVLVKVSAAGVNNTDINTRIGWYSKSVTTNTNDGGEKGFETTNDKDATWSGNALKFPRIQGADICGKIVSVGKDVDQSRIEERVIVRSMQSDPNNLDKISSYVIGSEIECGFAEYVSVRSSETFKINSNWSDVELASIPCAYSTAEGMLHRVELKDEKVLITGASGGVGSAAVQLAKRRGAYVIAQCSKSKFDEIKKIGADEVVDRNENLVKKLGLNEFDVTVDLVAGSNWGQLLDILKPGGRYVTAGAIAGPIVNLDVRILYVYMVFLFGWRNSFPFFFKNGETVLRS